MGVNPSGCGAKSVDAAEIAMPIEASINACVNVKLSIVNLYLSSM
jgi:hypothetical protein